MKKKYFPKFTILAHKTVLYNLFTFMLSDYSCVVDFFVLLVYTYNKIFHWLCIQANWQKSPELFI